MITGQVGRVLDELLFFIRMCEQEQRVKISPDLPTVEDYMSRRMGPSAVGVCLAIMEYVSINIYSFFEYPR